MSLRLSLVGLAVALLAGCGAGAPAATPAPTTPPTPTADGTTLSVVTSTNVYASIVSAVAGDRVKVTALIDDPAADPHSYESTPAAAAAVAGADLVVYNGGGYDDWMGQLVDAAGGHREVINVTALSGLDTGGEFNEHLWYRVQTVQQLAVQLATTLGTLDTAHTTEYTANAETFTVRATDEVLTPAEAIGKAHPGARVAVTEPVPGYLLQSAGLVDATPPAFAEAVEEDTDPPAAALAQTLALFGPDPVRALVVNAQTETPTTDRVVQAAQTGGVPIVEVTETLPPGAPDYLSWMRSQVDALAAAVDKG